MPPPPGYFHGMDKWDLGYVQHLVSYFVEVDSLTLLITGKIEALKYESLLSDIFPTKITVTSLVDLPGDPPGFRGPELAGGEPFILQSWALYRYLQQHPYDLVVFHDRDAPGFLAIRAKRTGLAFPQTQLITFLHSNHELCRYRTFQMPQDPVLEAKWAFAEKYSCEHADAVIVQTQSTLDWAIDQGWELQPDRVVWLPEVEGTATFIRPSQKCRPAHQAGACGFQAAPSPKVSVCVTHFNQKKHLSQLLPSIAANDYPAFEVVIVDDASTDPHSLTYFEEISRQYPEPRWRFLKNHRNLGPAATRNVAASHANGEYLIFMDGDNVATPNMISDFIRGMLLSGVDCLTCWFGIFRGDDPPGDASQWLYTFAPLGPCLEIGFLENIFGDTNFCIKKSVFDKLGGFDPTPGLVFTDWHLLARLSLRGFNQDVIPRELFWYRHHDEMRSRILASPHLMDCIYQAYQAQTSRPTRHILTRVTIPAVHQNRRLQQQLNRTLHRLAARLNHVLDTHPRLEANTNRAMHAWSYLRQGRVRRVLEESLAVLARGLAGGLKALTAQAHRLAPPGWSGTRRQMHLGRRNPDLASRLLDPYFRAQKESGRSNGTTQSGTLNLK